MKKELFSEVEIRIICVEIFVNTVVLNVHCDCQYCNKQYVYELFRTFCYKRAASSIFLVLP